MDCDSAYPVKRCIDPSPTLNISLMKPNVNIKVLNEQTLLADISGFAEILRNCVNDGASVGFMDDLTDAEAGEYWEKVAQRAKNFELVALGAYVDGEIAGTVQLIFSPQPNQLHRAEVAKLLVDPAYRRLGIAKSLMKTIEDLALELSRDLLVLDTITGSGAETLYDGLGWSKVGEIPRYALMPEGGDPLPTSVFYKDLKQVAA